MEEQSYAKHAKFVPLFHFVLFGLIALAFIGSLWNFYNHMYVSGQRTTCGLLVMVTFAMILQFFFSRIFPLKAQDRAIRAEENLRQAQILFTDQVEAGDWRIFFKIVPETEKVTAAQVQEAAKKYFHGLSFVLMGPDGISHRDVYHFQ